MRRVPLALIAVAVVAAGCSPTSEKDAAPEAAPKIAELPSKCRTIGGVPTPGQITFTVSGRLYGTSPDGTRARCLGDAPDGKLAWGGEGDRVLIDAAQTHLRTRELSALLGVQHHDGSWSRPTGTSVISVTGAGRLVKMPAAGNGEAADISFLARHDEAVYHPSGTHIVGTGKGSGGYGIYIAATRAATRSSLRSPSRRAGSTTLR